MSYKGKITTSGTSDAIRIEKDLFKQNPEFKQAAEVRADIIGRGRMLISLVEDDSECDEDDPIVNAFLSFIERDICSRPASIKPVNEGDVQRAKALTAGVTVSDDELE